MTTLADLITQGRRAATRVSFLQTSDGKATATRGGSRMQKTPQAPKSSIPTGEVLRVACPLPKPSARLTTSNLKL